MDKVGKRREPQVGAPCWDHSAYQMEWQADREHTPVVQPTHNYRMCHGVMLFYDGM
jgi:hypothetical protein